MTLYFLLACVGLCFGISIGCLIMNIYWLRRRYGIFKIDCTDPDKDICRLELKNLDLDTLAKQNYIVLKVDAVVPVSQEKQ